MNKETYDKLAEISAISGIPIEELEGAYDALAKQYDPKLDKTLKELGQKVELNKALDSFYMAVGNALFTTKIIEWIEDKIITFERWWKRKNR